MKKQTLLITAALMLSTTLFAQKDKVIETMSVDGRISYDYIMDREYQVTSAENTGFRGKYLYFNLAGHLSKTISYVYRQRLDELGSLPFLDGTELLSVKWDATPDIHISGGKQQVAVGGFEYNTAPIDRYNNTLFWNGFDKYQYGVAVDANLGRRDNLMLQFVNSPIRQNLSNIYGASLMWTGHHGFYDAIWSVNAMQQKGKFTGNKYYYGFAAIGNKFTFMPDFYLTIDAMARTWLDNIEFGKNYTISSELSGRPIKALRVFGKYTRDINECEAGDPIVYDNTNVNTGTFGVEYEALKNNIGGLRLYATGMYSWGDNYTGTIPYFNDEIRIEAGMKVSLDVIGSIKSLVK